MKTRIKYYIGAALAIVSLFSLLGFSACDIQATASPQGEAATAQLVSDTASCACNCENCEKNSDGSCVNCTGKCANGQNCTGDCATCPQKDNCTKDSAACQGKGTCPGKSGMMSAGGCKGCGMMGKEMLPEDW